MNIELSLERPQHEQADYTFKLSPLGKRVRAEFAGVTVVDSDRVMVMTETRLPPVYYFPMEDVRMDLMERADHRTNCPFKGNASYWTLRVGDREVANVMWGYEDPYPEAATIRGYVAFYEDLLDQWYEDDLASSSGPAPERHYDNPLLAWLIHEAHAFTDSKLLTQALAEKIVDVGIPLMRLNLILRTLHPQLMGVTYRWWRAKEEISERPIPYSQLEQPGYLNSPLVSIFEGAGGIRRRMEGPNPVLDFPILEELRAEGATDYVAMPITFSDGQINALTITSDRRGGFSTDDLGHIYEILSILARLYEVHAMRRTAVTLLDTYLGSHAGKRVLQGQIKRGDKQNINAVIWFCDLRESTPLAQSLSRDEFLGALNQFFDCMAGAVLDHGGQVLRFIGDAALAIFPLQTGQGSQHTGRPDEAIVTAIAAAREAAGRIGTLNEKRRNKGWPALEFGIALHVGEVTYGNIGTENRLEFTVVGDAANRAARIEAMCKTLNEPVLMSEEIARYFPDDSRSLGRHQLRGVAEPLEIFALRSPGTTPASPN